MIQNYKGLIPAVEKAANATQTRRNYKQIELLGFREASKQFKAQGCFSSGRTWENDDAANEAYDRGVNRAERKLANERNQ